MGARVLFSALQLQPHEVIDRTSLEWRLAHVGRIGLDLGSVFKQPVIVGQFGGTLVSHLYINLPLTLGITFCIGHTTQAACFFVLKRPEEGFHLICAFQIF